MDRLNRPERGGGGWRSRGGDDEGWRALEYVGVKSAC
jgi:hypothetical protein